MTSVCGAQGLLIYDYDFSKSHKGVTAVSVGNFSHFNTKAALTMNSLKEKPCVSLSIC